MRTRLLVAAAVTAIVIAGCSTASNASPAASGAPPSVAPTSGPPSAAAMQKINFVLDWTPNPFQNFVYAADKNGYYKDAGLDVSIAIPDSAIGSLQMIGTKKADIGLSVSTTRSSATHRASRSLSSERYFLDSRKGSWPSAIE